ncbi:GTP-binding protein TypA [Candidatus Daviesbacteria bacterium RIFCSPHIGHO2_01_FULL_44_29]|uniref:50S ribosomal subunit assembly factor BipA n=1 Tax=Candidatus Daviesbacteria bacterium RIFCSPHIGHO2_02_FULL_43_12 TaxID=1797776 RepID=A0A1F5KJX6_9BACT|nr:MAG: GTP-binding protein TypA [Candidatus Daviesbacteria bacterium RIFCSPHIGHO2_01_FULL_44_29]OGE39540.1 MAG: GTP-binding protein TypA [Candidatus Daviesbacteria bacterium RIFCSPHIGHO2_12_FULL_47_45]OGE41184.1 MAG: GTP-binding protein TypA [Candidatus Daviesbacteria bacterium RIFCSPHIGHO2_02_FULL_43_12]OGE69383.1 MAG: GTP-binding protein TypA [Candidatus Daviesbacteria bacterium RIFCSPLOWO2_01_FULL_43_15]
MNNIRNVAIIAHVDHGKTTLVDALLRQTQTKLGKEFTDTSELIMDSNELEKERGITIFSKNASVDWNGTKINIIDTPGHADFGGEVERVLKMADGCLLLIDAKEGPMPQTRFVLKQALAMKLKIIVVVNKIDKPDARIDHVISKTFDLFLELGADEDAAYFPVVYASGKNGLAGLEPDLSKMTSITPVFEAIMEHIPAPQGDPTRPLQVLITTLSPDNYKGRIATGRVINGTIKAGQDVVHINRSGEQKRFRLTSLMSFVGLGRVDALEAQAGDIVALSGIPDITIGETISDPQDPIALPLLAIEEPTVRMTFSVNASPFAGREGEFKTSRQIRDRLYKELETDVALRVADDTSGGWIVSGRGELHLAILIERLRREGYEFQVSRPQVIEKVENGKKLTPYERLFIEVPDDSSGVVMQKLGIRHAELQDMNSDNGITYLEFVISTKELFGYRSEFITDTRGLGLINSSFLDYREDTGTAFQRDRGSLIAFENGSTKLYGLTQIQDRGILFIAPATEVYKGQVIGQNARSGDMSVNVCKEKQQTNMRSRGEGVSEHFNIPKVMGLEEALEYIDDSELVEVTPKTIRLRKIDLNKKY